jgi:hypothetical protein
MQRRFRIVLPLVVFLLGWVLVGSAAVPQASAPSSLQVQLEAQYPLTKKIGTTLVPGCVLTLLKDGVVGVPLSNPRSLVAKYHDGALHAPSAQTLADFGNDARPLPKGDKFYVTRIDVNLREDWIRLHIVECGACNGAVPAGSFKSIAGFQFTQGFLRTARTPEVEDNIAQVFTLTAGSASRSEPAPGAPPNPIYGVYTSTLDPADNLQLNADHSFSLQEAGQSYHGAFAVKGNTLELTISESYIKTTATIQGDRLIDSGGQTWTRAPAPGPPPVAAALQNQDVVKMVKAGSDDGAIIARISSSKCQFDTSPEALIKLHQSGVSPAVIKAMIGAGT